MSIATHNDPGLTLFYVALSNTDVTVAFSAQKAGFVINEAHIVNTTGSGVSCELYLYSKAGSLVLELEPGETVAASSPYRLDTDGIPLAEGMSLRVKGDSGVYCWGTYYNATYLGGFQKPPQLTT